MEKSQFLRKANQSITVAILVFIPAFLLFVAELVGITYYFSVYLPRKEAPATPTNICIDDGLLIWDSVPLAEKYRVVFYQEDKLVVYQEVKETYVNPNRWISEGGSYTVSITACAEGRQDSLPSEKFSFYIPHAVENVECSYGFLEWKPIDGYKMYCIATAQGEILKTVDTSDFEYWQTARLNINDFADRLSPGENEIYVCVAGDDSENIACGIPGEFIKINKLFSPTEVSIKNNMLSWESIYELAEYSVKITDPAGVLPDITYITEDTSLYLLNIVSSKGSYEITVQTTMDCLNHEFDLASESSTIKYQQDDNVYKVSTVDDLRKISDDLSGIYILQNDINLGGQSWTPIGTIAQRFEGALVGNGHTISGLKLTSNSTKGNGFFGVVGENGVVNNVIFENVSIDGGSSGYIGAVAGVSYGMLSSVKVYGTVGVSEQGAYVGGLVGRNFGTTQYCTNYATVKGNSAVGGIAGNYEFANAGLSFAGCSNEGKIYGKERVGGLVGYLKVARMTHIASLTNQGDVSASQSYAGGIVGYAEGVSGQTGSFDSCQNTASVYAALDYAGGCFGAVGNYINVTVENVAEPEKICSNTGLVSSAGSHKDEIYNKK